MKKYLDKILIVIAVIIVVVGIYIKDKKESELSIVEGKNEEVSLKEEENIGEKTNKEKEEVELIAYISGLVKNPGVYNFEEGDRIIDLVNLAGGFLDNANKDINLAMRLKDETHIYIPSIGEEVEVEDNLNVSSDSSSEKVNLNTASKEELMTLSGIGDKKADEIISYREGQKFEQIEDIMNISGIGEKTFEKLKNLICV